MNSDLSNLKGIIVPGFIISVYDEGNYPFLKELKSFIKNIYDNFPHIKLLGVCGGSQLIANALGGKVEKIEALKTSNLPVLMK